MKRTGIIIGLIISLIIVPCAVFAIASFEHASDSATLTNAPPERTSANITTAIVSSVPTLANSNGRANFTLTSFRRLEANWYVAWLDGDTVKVLINDPAESAQYMQVLLGPATVFDQTSAESKGVPDKVFQEFSDAKV